MEGRCPDTSSDGSSLSEGSKGGTVVVRDETKAHEAPGACGPCGAVNSAAHASGHMAATLGAGVKTMTGRDGTKLVNTTSNNGPPSIGVSKGGASVDRIDAKDQVLGRNIFGQWHQWP